MLGHPTVGGELGVTLGVRRRATTVTYGCVDRHVEIRGVIVLQLLFVTRRIETGLRIGRVTRDGSPVRLLLGSVGVHVHVRGARCPASELHVRRGWGALGAAGRHLELSSQLLKLGLESAVLELELLHSGVVGGQTDGLLELGESPLELDDVVLLLLTMPGLCGGVADARGLIEVAGFGG